MTPKEFITDLEENVYCRLAPSKVHGIGVFAIRDIPKGMNPFRGCRPAQWSMIPWSLVEQDPRIPGAVKQLAQDIYAIENGMLHIPDHGLNDVDISYFVNHSSEPNTDVTEYEDRIEFTARQDIVAGEELTADYATYLNGF